MIKSKTEVNQKAFEEALYTYRTFSHEDYSMSVSDLVYETIVTYVIECEKQQQPKGSADGK
jgi:hypothetical protein